MTKDVDAREKELTHQVHREWLLRSLEQVKQLTPVLISSVKIYVSTKAGGTLAPVYNMTTHFRSLENVRDLIFVRLKKF
jgi:hypothetical protein